MSSLSRLKSMTKVQLRLMLLPAVLPAIVFALLSPFVFSVKNLDSVSASMAIERFFSLFGIILLTPVILPEQSENIHELICSKRASYPKTIALRYLVLLPLLIFLSTGICVVMKLGGSDFPMLRFVFGGTVTAFSLGALGFFAYCISGNWIAGYLAPVCFFTLNMGSAKMLGNFYLFSLSYDSLMEKYWLLSAAVVLSILGILLLGARIWKNK